MFRLTVAVPISMTRNVALFLLGCSLLLSPPAWGGAGDLLWEDEVVASPNSVALTIAAQDGRVFAAGEVRLDVDTFDFLLRAYEAKTGELLWSDRGTGLFSGVAAAAGRVFANGTNVVGPNHTRPGFFLRAYKGNQGQLLWETSGSDSLWSIAATKSTLFVVGSNQNEFLVRAYAANTGVILWEDRVQGQGLFIAEANDRVIAGGRSATNDFLLRAYDGRTGALLWEDETINVLFAVASDGRRVFAAGSTDSFLSDWLVRTYDATDDTLLWEDLAGDLAPDQICRPPRDPVPCNDIAFATDPGAGRLFMAGTSQNPATGGTGTVIRAYKAETGALVWEDRRTSTLAVPQIIGIQAQGRQVFTVTRCCQGFDRTLDFRLRAYDAKTGVVDWEDQISGFPLDLTVESGRVFTAGGAGPDPESSFLIRAYDAR